MRSIKIILFLYVLYLLQGCSDSIKGENSGSGFFKKVKSIKIFNKTQNKFIVDSIEITDTAKISRIGGEIRNLKEFP
jgi:hypothetical protein